MFVQSVNQKAGARRRSHVIGIKGPQCDHGIATVQLDRIIDFTNYINSSDYIYVATSPSLHIFSNSGMLLHRINH